MSDFKKLGLIYEYIDYRKYLQDYYQQRKNDKKGFSLSHFSKLAGLNSPNYLKLIMDGDRNLSIDNIFAFSKALDFSEDETRYFEILVHFNQCQSQASKNHYKRLLKNIRATKPKRGTRLNESKALSQWFYMAILITANKKTEGDFCNWAKELGISEHELKNAIQELIKSQVLIIKKNKYCVVENFFLLRNKKATNIQQKKYLFAQLQQSLKKFNEYHQGAKFVSHTLLINQENFENLLDKIYDFLQTVTVELEKDTPLNQLVQINLQAFKIGQPLN